MKASIFILFLFHFLSCTNKKVEQKSFEIDLPKDYQSTESIFEVKKIAKHIGLDSLAKPSDTIRLRISIGFGIVAGINIYEIQFTDSSWSGTHYFFQDKAFIRSYLKNRQHDGFNDEIDSIWIAKKFAPLCGWENFMDTINSFGVLNIRDKNDIPDYNVVSLDGDTYVFEWSNKTKYRYYTFDGFSNSQCTENKTFQKFKIFFKSQIGFFEYCWPRCWIEKKD
jgi:hypothetical protein